MTTGGLYVIGGIDVVATLVPEEDAWQFEAAETCTTETQLWDGEQESIAVVNCRHACSAGVFHIKKCQVRSGQ